MSYSSVICAGSALMLGKTLLTVMRSASARPSVPMEKYAPRSLKVGTPITRAKIVAAMPPRTNASEHGQKEHQAETLLILGADPDGAEFLDRAEQESGKKCAVDAAHAGQDAHHRGFERPGQTDRR